MKVRSDFLSNLALIVPSLPIKATSTKLSIGSKDALLSIQRYLDVLEGILQMRGSQSNPRFDDTYTYSSRNTHFGSWKNPRYAKCVLVETDSYVLYVSTYQVSSMK